MEYDDMFTHSKAHSQKSAHHARLPFFSKGSDNQSSARFFGQVSSPPVIHKKCAGCETQPQIQTKLTIGAPNDKYEQEADRVADQVMRPEGSALGAAMPDSKLQRQLEEDEAEEETLQLKPLADQITPLVQRQEEAAEEKEEEEPLQESAEPGLQRQTEEEEKEEETPLQAKLLADQVTPLTALGVQRRCQGCEKELTRKLGPRGEQEDELSEFLQREAASTWHGGDSSVARPIAQRISNLKGGGQPLPATSRTFMEQRFGTDFGDVRVHHNQESGWLSSALNARAFTTGKDVFFNQGLYSPTSQSGKRLLAHELTHVLQQTEGQRIAGDTVQRTIGDGHDLTAPLFTAHRSRVLEAAYDNQITLKQGRRGRAVRLLQQALVNLGYVLPRFGVDGVFGPRTETAVRAFQVDTGATVDGLVQEETLGNLDARLQGQPVAPLPLVRVGEALPAANVIVAPGAAPSNALPACGWGLTFPENVTSDFVAIRHGPNWVPVVTGLTGNYSLQARLLPGATEVTGPGRRGNTTAANYCAQVRDLNNPSCGMAWDMIAATVEHERVHARYFRAALVTRTPAIEASIEALSVPHAAGMNAATAEALLRALPAFAAAMTNAQRVWLAECVATAGHGTGTIDADTRAAERTVYDPMIRRICNHARGRRGWAACRPPC